MAGVDSAVTLLYFCTNDVGLSLEKMVGVCQVDPARLNLLLWACERRQRGGERGRDAEPCVLLKKTGCQVLQVCKLRWCLSW